VKQFATRYGRFSPDGKAYHITTPRTPRPWINVISNGDYGLTVSQTGSGYSWRTHAQLNRLTRWEQDLVKDEWGKYIYVRDERGTVWSAGWKPVCAEPDAYECIHAPGVSTIRSLNAGIESELTVFVPNDEPLELWKLTLRNRTRRPRTLTLFTYFEWALGQSPDWHREFHKSFIETSYGDGTLYARKRLWEVPTDRGHWNTEWPYVAFHSSSITPSGYDGDKESFLGQYGSVRDPAAVRRKVHGKRTGNWLDAVASLAVTVRLRPREARSVCFSLGAADSHAEARTLSRKYRSLDEADRALAGVRERWSGLLSQAEVSTPDDATNIMLNGWLSYQAISGRLWGRTAYYQTGGAFGFRDQLQDSQIFLPIDASKTKAQILLHARHQFKDGTVYHWWHPLTELGLHNDISDNLLWLPFVVHAYLQETADFGLLDEKAPFVDDAAGATVYEHCLRSIRMALGRLSPRGLPLIGAGDWNDGLSAVGLAWKGESVWMGHFLHLILTDFASVCLLHGDAATGAELQERAVGVRNAVNAHGWDGKWYFRGTKDSGEPFGSAGNAEGKVFLNAQTWAVIAGVADSRRSEQVMNVVEQSLEYKAGPLLLYPGYTTPDREIGYLTRYAAGMRENGGVYTHAATWAVWAEALLGRGENAYRMFSKLNPINRGKRPDEYTAEPYVTAGNIEGPDSRFYGRGGWTWYTGSAAWLWKVGMEQILGIRPTVGGLVVDPCIPHTWKGFTVRRRFRGALYRIEVRNPHGVEKGVREIVVNGRCCTGNVLPIGPPASEQHVVVTLGGPP
jgi:cellobiose phosphorylase